MAFNFNTVFTANNKKFNRSVGSMKANMKGLNKSFIAGERDTRKYFATLRKNDNLFAKMSKDANRASGSINNVGKSFRGIKSLMGVGLVVGLATGFQQSIQSAMDMVETANLFSVAMGDMATSTNEFVQEFAEVSGLDPTNLQESVGTFSLLARSMGFATDQSRVLSENTAKLALDLSSLTNVPIQQVMKDLRSGLVGQSETVYKYGIDVTEASLKTEALNQGITKSVREMTQGEKMALRYAVMIRQTTLAQGDFAKTIETPANQLRILKERFVTASRSIGTIFIPAIALALPYANALLVVVRDLADALAKLFGYEPPVIEDTLGDIGNGADNVGDELDDANDSAKKLKGTLMGFDEINLLKDPTGSSTGLDGDGGDDSDFDLEGYDNGMANIKIRADEIAESIKDLLSDFTELFSGVDPSALITAIGELAKAFEPFLEDGAQSFKFFVDEILVPFTTWTVNELLPNGIETLTELFNLLAPAVEWASDKLDYLWDNYLGPASEFVGDKIIEGLTTLKQLFIDLGDENSEVRKQFRETFEFFKTLYDIFIAPTVETLMADFDRMITDGIEPFKEILESLAESVGPYIKDLMVVVGGALVVVFWLMQNTVRKIVSGVINTLTDLLQAFQVFGQLLDGVTRFYNAMVEGNFEDMSFAIRLILEGLFNLVALAINRTINKYLGDVNLAIKAINKVLGAMGQTQIPELKVDLSLDFFDSYDKDRETTKMYQEYADFRNGRRTPTDLGNFNAGLLGLQNLSMNYQSADMSSVNTGATYADVFGAPEIAELFADSVYEALSQVEADRANSGAEAGDVVLNIDGVEFARAMLPRMDREAIRQGYDGLLLTDR